MNAFKRLRQKVKDAKKPAPTKTVSSRPSTNRNPRKGPTVWNKMGQKPVSGLKDAERTAVLSNPNARTRGTGGMGKMG